MITVSILDDHKVLVKSLSKLINDSGKARVNGRAGLEKAFPDVLLLDIGLPDGDCVEFCAEQNLVRMNLKNND